MTASTADPASSSRTNQRRLLLACLTVCLLSAGCSSNPATGGKDLTQGHALDGGMQSTGRAGTENAQLGEVFWAALPLPSNTSRDPLTISKARFTTIPKGLKVSEYKVFDVNEVGGVIYLAYSGGKYGTRNPEKYRDHSSEPLKVKGRTSSHYYYAAKVTVTGPVKTDLEGCRYWYEQKGREYRQDVPCQTTIRLGPPLTEDN
ncbi:hypothetical protein ACF1AO_34465 [Streptomyces longwoodensis]|uniref:hypothetical protein n=1 Tax=Streptomyces longwoodensis TaxID=68231 RepID=UPI0036F98B35